MTSRENSLQDFYGSAVVSEIWVVLHDEKPFDRERFVGVLEKLE